MEMDKESENTESISGSYYKWSRFSLLCENQVFQIKAKLVLSDVVGH